ncbi:aminodeoxychorismate synthase component I [Thermoproteota archaeon]
MNNCTIFHKKLKFSSKDLLSILSRSETGFLLESSLNAFDLGRFSFFGIDPFLILSSKDRRITTLENGSMRRQEIGIFDRLRSLLSEYRIDTKGKKIGIPFLGGAVGFLTYDLGFYLEKIPRCNPKDLSIPDAWFAFFDLVVCLDHYKNEIYVISSGFPEKSKHLRRKRGEERLRNFLDCLEGLTQDELHVQNRILPQSRYQLKSNFTHKDYIKAVDRARDYITKGDIYQINLSQRFSTKTDLSSEQLYGRLREEFPVPFGGILKTDDFSIISGSPERFMKYDGHFLFTRPMKGTRPRSNNRLQDKRFRRELEQSPKDKAELLMIIDLERNDLGRVCDYGSVKVEKMRSMEEYSTVFQTTSQIRGELHSKRDRIDIIKACFPGGSITGCPKIRAMQIIEELEPNRRGIYTGSLGYFGFNGTMDFNILIRSFFKRQKDVYFGVGGGIVYDSKPEEEYKETLVKAEALKRALSVKKPNRHFNYFHEPIRLAKQ